MSNIDTSKFKPVTHVIFDLDGLLLDTERLYTEATQVICSDYGKQYTWEIKVQCMGMKGYMAAQHIISSLDLPLTVDEYLKRIVEQYDTLFPTAKLLPDTEKLYSESTQAVVDTYGKVYTWEIKCPLMGRVGIELAEAIVKSLDLPLSPHEYLSRVEKQYAYFFPQAKLLPGADRLVRHLHNHNIPIAIASGGAQDSYELKTTNHKDFVSMFKHVVLASTDPEVKNGKPAPDVFLICAKRFEDPPKPEQCLVFEDAPNGVAAATAAGMQVVMVPDQRMADTLKKDATVVLKSLEDFHPEWFGLPPY
ncbi:pseudouridine-5'-phosphatase isoform X2 [Palaemon carinicauda]|uniref:pseudouridine-5'-phosphatase isoform X2 n=1 Tax=Palaemon carinicauda TaxID=392227 RepID=UPI0035B5BEC2